ncbi:DUF981 family protein [Corynebacterium frankenforstense]
MTLTWPLEQIDGAVCCAVDNVAFGEPAAFYGIITLIAGFAILRGEDRTDRSIRDSGLVDTLRPILYVVAAGGIGLIFFAIAGLHFSQWRPPAVEPIARMLEGSPPEPLTAFTMYFGTGVAAMLSPFALTNKKVRTIFIRITWFIGMMRTFLGLTLFYGHVGFFPLPFNEPVPHPTL